MQIPQQAPDVIEAGRVMATLDDWRAIMFIILFVFVFIVVTLLAFIVWRENAMQKERVALRELAKSFSDSAADVAKSLGDLSTKIAVLAALTARAEATIDKATSEKDHGHS